MYHPERVASIETDDNRLVPSPERNTGEQKYAGYEETIQVLSVLFHDYSNREAEH